MARKTSLWPALTLMGLLGVSTAADAAVSTTPGTVTLSPGQTSAPITVTLVFPTFAMPSTGTVGVSFPSALAGRASTLPSTITYSWPTSDTPGSTTTFRIALTTLAPPGTYTVTVTDLTRGSGSATLTLVIPAPPTPTPPPPPPPDFAFRVEPTTVVLQAGGAAAPVRLVTDRRTLTEGTITYAPTGLPAGVTAGSPAVGGAPAFAPVEIALSAAITAQPGQYGATIRGVFRPGNLTREQPLVIIVRPPRPQVDAIDPAVLAAGTPNHPVRVHGRFFKSGARLEGPAYLRFTPVRVLSPTLIEAAVSVRADAPPGPVAIAVRNPDGQGSPDGARLAVVPVGSLAAPLAVRAAAVVYPAPGSLYAQNEAVRPRGTLLTTASGPIVLTWLFNGVPFDRTVVQARGGHPVSVEAHMPLPAAALGPHRLQLAVEGPQPLMSEPITVIQVVSRASRLRPIWPADGAVAMADRPATFRWSAVAGAAAYDVELVNDRGRTVASLPAERAERRVGPQELADLPAGTYEWSVRPRFAGGTRGESSERRRLTLLPIGVELALETPRTDPTTGRIETRWNGGVQGLLYRVEFLDGSGGTTFSALTGRSQYLLPRGRALPSRSLRVTAFGPGGRVVGRSAVLEVGDPGSLAPETGSPVEMAGLKPCPTYPTYRAVAGLKPCPTYVAFQPRRIGATSPRVVLQQPEPDREVDTTRPAIEARWEPPIAPEDVTLLIDTTDVTAVATVASDRVAYSPLLALAPGEHTVNLVLGESLVSWTFNVTRAGALPAESIDAAGDVDQRSALDEGDARAGGPAVWHVNAEGTLSHQSGDGMATGYSSYAMLSVNGDTGEPATHGAFARVNGDLAVSHDFSGGDGTSQDNRNWVVGAGAVQGDYRQQFGVGYVPPSFLAGAELVTAGLATGGVEATLGGPQASVSYYQTVDGDLAGVSTGTFGPEQRLRAAALELGGEARPFTLRFVGMRVDEDDGEFFFGGRGDLLGVIGRWQLAPQSELRVEVARGSMRPSPDSLEESRRGNAARLAWTARFGQVGIDASIRHTAAEFVNPANRGLTVGGVPDRTGGEVAVTRTWQRSSLRGAYQRTQTASGIGSGDGALDTLDIRWSGSLHPAVMLSVGGNAASTRSREDEELFLPEVDQRDWSVQVGLQETAGMLMLAQNVSFQRSDDDADPGRFVEMSQAALSATVGGVDRFQFMSQLSWVRSRTGLDRDQRDSWLAVIQPSLRLPQGIEVQPYASYSLTRDDLSPEDATTRNYRITLTWMPRWARSYLAVQGSGDWARHRGPGVISAGTIARYTASLTLRWNNEGGPSGPAMMSPGAEPGYQQYPLPAQIAPTHVLTQVAASGLPPAASWR